MQSESLCFGKVKNDCVKFITSQETANEKFKNKEKMIKSFLIPICFWIAKKADKQKPYFYRLSWRTRNWQNYNQLNYKDYTRKIF